MTPQEIRELRSLLPSVRRFLALAERLAGAAPKPALSGPPPRPAASRSRLRAPRESELPPPLPSDPVKCLAAVIREAGPKTVGALVACTGMPFSQVERAAGQVWFSEGDDGRVGFSPAGLQRFVSQKFDD